MGELRKIFRTARGRATLSGEEFQEPHENELEQGGLHHLMWHYPARKIFDVPLCIFGSLSTVCRETAEGERSHMLNRRTYDGKRKSCLLPGLCQYQSSGQGEKVPFGLSGFAAICG